MPQQYVSLFFEISIFIGAIILWRIDLSVKYVAPFMVLYGLIGLTYYVLILFFDVPGHALSTYRVMTRSAMITALLWGYILDDLTDIVNRWIHQ